MRYLAALVTALAVVAGWSPAEVEGTQLESFGSEWSFTINQRCQVWNAGEREAEPFVWTGDCVDGKVSGTGKLSYAAGTYMGPMKAGKAHGSGKLIMFGAFLYIGEFRNGKFHGDGTARWPIGASYEGEWRHGEINGQGVYIWPSGKRYEGEFLDGQPNGWGTVAMADGDAKTCEWRDGKSVDGTCTYH